MNLATLFAASALLVSVHSGSPKADFVVEGTLTTADASLQAHPDLTDDVLCAAEPGGGLLLVEGSGVLRLYSQERPPTRTGERTNADGTSTVETSTTEATAGLYRAREWRVAPGVFNKRRSSQAGALILAPWKADGVWIVDTENRELARLDGEQWSSPMPFREPVASASALPDGKLVVNTPESPVGAFAVVDRQGKIERAFGDRRSSVLGSLLGYANTWRLAVLPGGELVAAHAYANLVRRYSADGRLLWERVLHIPEAEKLEVVARRAAERISRGVDPCCVKAEVVAFATVVIPGGGDHALIRFGGSPVLFDLNAAGEVTGRVGITTREQGKGWETAGLARVGERLVAVERNGAVVYRKTGKEISLEGSVVNAEGRPVPEAGVSVTTPGGKVLNTSADLTGRFRLDGIPSGTTGELRAEAEGYLETTRSGIIRELLARPIVLAKKPVLCVVARTADTRAPVTDYRLSIMQSLRSIERVALRMGPEHVVRDPAGRACLAAPFLGPWLVRVKAAGFATSEVRLAEAGETEVSLAKEARLEVDVVGPGDEPVEGVQLFVEEAAKEDLRGKALTDDRVTKTDREGHGRFDGLMAGEYRITASREGFLVASAAVVASEGENPVAMKLSRGARVSVRVVTADSAPIRGADVEISVQGAAPPRVPRCVTDEAGRCETDGVPPGSASIVARGPDGATGHAVKTIAEFDRGASVEVVLRNGVRVEGTVAGAEQWPGADLVVRASAVGVPLQEAVVTDRGTFLFSQVPPGKVAFFVFARRLDSDLHFESVEVPRDRELFDLVLRLPPPITLSGRLTRTGAGCGTCSVAAERLGADGARPTMSVGATPDGQYILRLPTRGRYRLDAADLSSDSRDSEIVTLDGDTELDLELEGATLTGTVFLPTGRPAAGASVVVSGDSGSTLGDGAADDLGRYRLTGLTRGTWKVGARLRTATASRVVVIGKGETKTDLVLADDSAIRLRLFDSETGAPILRAAVRALSARGEVSFQMDARAENGQEISVAAPGTGPWTVVIGAPGFAVKTVRHLSGGDAAVGVAMVARYRAFTVEVGEGAGTPCSFQLLDGTGLPIAMSIYDLPGPVPFSIRQAFFNQFEPGDYTAVLGLCNGKSLRAPLQLAPGTTGSLKF